MKLRHFLLAIALSLVAFSAYAADNNFPTPGGSTVPGAVNMCLNGSSQAVACSAASPLPITGTITPAGNAGAVTQSSVSVTNASTSLLTAAQFTNFEKVCVALTAATGVWVNWAGVAAVAAAPSEYIPPGQCDTWVKSTGFMPTAAAFAFSNSASTIAVTVEGN